ncbi:F-box domain-containing protein [Mycena sanguinolenta]|uniref:F-box domain-containing protein n=1 Tax=Mycena sanguinolenta TaxID=230812 RepID=A0A8H7DG19_9AGAR|nr:F-box domain-containing protein [Mycena sanguinolenta]
MDVSAPLSAHLRKRLAPSLLPDRPVGAESLKVEPQPDSYEYDEAAEKVLLRKQDLRIIPLSATIYLLAYLDRSNIGNAKILNSETHNDLLSETHMTAYQYTIALMIFLVAYALFEVPSNYLLKRLSPSRWIAFLMLVCGSLSMGLGGTHSYAEVTVVRFLLGGFEAGLFPGLVYFLTFWYRAEERSLRVAFILASATLAGAFGGAIAYGVGHMNGDGALSGWRWLFLLGKYQNFLRDTAHWLTENEKKLAKYRLKAQGSDTEQLTWRDVRETLTEWRLYAHYLVYFGVSLAFSSLSLFTPSIVAGLGYQSLKANLMTVPPYAVAYVVTLIASWSADRYNARGIHAGIACVIGAAGFMASALLPATAYAHRYGCLILASAGVFASIPPLLCWITSNIFTASTAGLVIALNISFGTPGQIVGVWIYKANEVEKGFPTGHWTNCALLLFAAAGCFMLTGYYRRRNGAVTRRGERLYRY